ncbi:MAG: formimidoylglutamate deiminase [Actinomycetota bacterium]|nr:formimidoylglutamate deiminase [Actinomycetota bacterium]
MEVPTLIRTGHSSSGPGRYRAKLVWVGGTSPALAKDVLFEVLDGRIAAMAHQSGPPSDDVVELAGLTIPGLANAHSHAFQRALRGKTQARTRGGDFWSWRDAMYSLAARLDPDRLFDLARAVYGEMALAGVCAVGEFHYLHHDPTGKPYGDPNAMGAALVEAASEAGVKLTLLDTCYLQGGFDRPLEGPQERFGDRDAHAWAERVGSIQVSDDTVVGAAIHSVRAVDPSSMEVVREWAHVHDAPLHVHVSEQRAENEACLAATGHTPVGLLEASGILGPMTTAVHATHLKADDITRLGARSTRVCLCPTTERDLADGVGPAGALVRAGSSLCLGSDSQAVVDIFEEARAVELDERLVTERRGHHSAVELLGAATAGGMGSLGRSGGVLEPGAPADFVTVRLDSPRTAGAGDSDALDHLVFAAGGADVTHVVVGGRAVVVDGVHVALGDVGRALKEAITPLCEEHL